MPDAKYPDPPHSKRSWWIGGGICLAVLGATVLTALISLRRDLSPSECVKLEQLKNISIAHLENGRYEEKREIGHGDLSRADAGFAELASKLPGDPLGPRNLAITRLLELREKLIAPENALQAAELMLQLEDQAAAAHLLAGQLALEAGEPRRAVAEIARAAEIAPNDAAIWYAVSRLWIDSQEAAERQRGYEALGRAYQADTGNLFVQAAWLAAQARANDPQLSETLHAFREALAARTLLLENVRSRGRIADPLAAIEAAQRALETKQAGAAADVLRLVDALRSENCFLDDLRRVDRDPLELVRHDFRMPCRDETVAAESAPLEVKFTEFPAPLQPPPLLGMSDVKLADMDLDGRLDVIALRETSLEIYGRLPGTGDWRRMANASLPPGFTRVLAVDLDQDEIASPAEQASAPMRATESQRGPADDRESPPESGSPAGASRRSDLELAVFGEAGLSILQCEASDDGQTRSLLGQTPEPVAALEAVTAVATIDFDHDGDLDLVVSSDRGLSFWSNHRGLRFHEVEAGSEPPPRELHASAISPVDWDRDGDLDLIIAGSGGRPAGWLENVRPGQFRWRSFADDFPALAHAQIAVVFDADGNGSWAVASCGTGGLDVVRTESGPPGPPAARTSSALTHSPRSGVLSWDYDNDGNLDLLSWDETAVDIYRGVQFVPAPQLLARTAKPIRNCETGDLDADGDLDLAIAEADRIVLYANEGGDQNQWLNVELSAGTAVRQHESCRVNGYGIGSLIEIRSGPRYQRRLVTAGATHFGLGRHGSPDVVRIVWTNGAAQDVIRPGVNRSICEVRLPGVPFPYVEPWTGENGDKAMSELTRTAAGRFGLRGQLHRRRFGDGLPKIGVDR